MKKFCIIIILTVFFSSCSPQENENGGNPNPPEYKDTTFNHETHYSQKAAWESMGIDRYQYTVEVREESGPPRPFIVLVAPGKEPVVTTDIPEYEVLISRFSSYGRTITEVFAYIEQRDALNLSPIRGTSVKYHEKYHYPESYSEFYTILDTNGGWYGFGLSQFVHEDEKLSLLDEWRAQKAVWESLGIDHYRYTSVSSSTPNNISSTFTVFRGRPERMYTAEELARQKELFSEQFPGIEFHLPPGWTIPDEFDMIKNNILNAGKDEQVQVRYNERYHYPEELKRFQKGQSSGSGRYFSITSFEDLREQ